MISSSTRVLHSVWVLTLLAVAIPATAQFNGPGVVTGGALNQPTPVTTDQSLLYPEVHNAVISPGDTIAVRIYGQPDLGSTTIDVNGNAELPLIGKIKLSGLTATQAEAALAAKLVQDGMFHDPQVTVLIGGGPASSVVFLGEKQGVVPISGSRTLLEVLAANGGLPSTASHTITILRRGVSQPIIVQLSTDPAQIGQANVPVFPGDTIILSKIGVVYVVGAFKISGKIDLNSTTPLTLIELSALAGGPAFQAAESDLRLIRTVGDHRTVTKLDLKKIMYGRQPDPILQANDILFLPDNTMKAAISNGTLGTVLGLASFGISLAFIDR
jgi:polysaccharide export outer membrane protein